VHLEWFARLLSNAAMPLFLAHITPIELGPLFTNFLAGLVTGVFVGGRLARRRSLLDAEARATSGR
jgi:uncharacterized membrane protein